MSADRLTDCPQDDCIGPVKRRIGAGAGFVFKGSGFYSTDYRSDSYKKGAAAEKSGKKSTSDSKPKSDSSKNSTSSPKKNGAS